MTEGGYIAIARGFFDHPVFACDPFTEREAFQWLLFEAAWKARTVRRGNTVFELRRGELAHSERFMAEAWQWSRSKVTRFLKKLIENRMIERKSNHDASHIIVCNYDKYQNPRTTKRATSEPPANHQRTKLEEGNQVTNKPKKEEAPDGAPTPDSELSKVLDQTRTQAVIEHRKKKRAPLTAHAASLLARKFAACADPNAAADAMVANGWQGFEPGWLTNRDQPRANGPPRQRTYADAAMKIIAESNIEPSSPSIGDDDVKFLPSAAGRS